MDDEGALRELEERVGVPSELWDELQEELQVAGVERLDDVGDLWLRFIWALDSHRIAGLPPRGLGRQELEPSARLAAIYRSKGNYFSTVLALLLQNQTSQPIKPRTKVQGFSQLHQVDLAWPSRRFDPRVCVESKVSGAPAYGSTGQRGALSDWSNRRKEIKFAATDLKLYRRQQATSIRHWGQWREHAPPKTYFVWSARLRSGRSPERLATLLTECQALLATYLDGAGVAAWRQREDGLGYEWVAVPVAQRHLAVDDVLHRVASEIQDLADQEGEEPPIHTPTEPLPIPVDQLIEDRDSDDSV